MRIAYYDESGDDGYPHFSSALFALSAIYFHHLKWKENYEKIRLFRRELKIRYGLPVRMEMHARHFLLNKNPYRELGITNEGRIQIVGLFCQLIASLEVQIINVVIIKPLIKKRDYDVLDTALKYSIQRIENDLTMSNLSEERFMIITDQGRLGKMRQTARHMQAFNYIPSKFSPVRYRNDVKLLIEDPLAKDSKESHFIQLADLVSHIVYLHTLSTKQLGPFSNRLKEIISDKNVGEWMGTLKPAFNLKAAKETFGIVYHPK